MKTNVMLLTAAIAALRALQRNNVLLSENQATCARLTAALLERRLTSVHGEQVAVRVVALDHEESARIIPLWVNFIAYDQDGSMYGYENLPTFEHDGEYWERDGGRYVMLDTPAESELPYNDPVSAIFEINEEVTE